VLVPPAYHQVIPGLHMKMGKVKAIRDGSPASQAAVQPGDRILAVEMTDGEQIFRAVSAPSAGKLPANVTEKVLDPVRLPFGLQQWAAGRSGVKATITVARDNLPVEGERKRLQAVSWDPSWRFVREVPIGPAAPLSIPELGLAYQIDTLVDKLEPGSPVAGKLRASDVIVAVSFKVESPNGGEKWGPKLEMPLEKERP